MRIHHQPKALQKQVASFRRKKKKIGFVPTMGALHEGHLSLVRKAKRECDVVIVSIFVNPTQFGPREDFAKYPRTIARDKRLLKKENVDILFSPSVKAMYPEGDSTFVRVTGVTNRLCGLSRPGHFQGVATVVLKLFNAVMPDVAYFGQKDYQQFVVIRNMVSDLLLPVRISLGPIVREADGLAMSSRNRYLKQRDRLRAREIYQVLKWMKSQPRLSLAVLKNKGKQKLRKWVDRVDYLEIVDLETLVSLKQRKKKMVIACACFVGKTRLIDNVIIRN